MLQFPSSSSPYPAFWLLLLACFAIVLGSMLFFCWVGYDQRTTEMIFIGVVYTPIPITFESVVTVAQLVTNLPIASFDFLFVKSKITKQDFKVHIWNFIKCYSLVVSTFDFGILMDMFLYVVVCLKIIFSFSKKTLNISKTGRWNQVGCHQFHFQRKLLQEI